VNNRRVADLASLHRIQACLDTYADQLAAVDLAYLRGKLDELVDRLDLAVADQAESQVSARSNARLVNEAREHLITHHLDPIVEFARSKVSETGAMQTVQLPADDASEIDVVAIATATAKLAAMYRERFVQLGLPPGFIEELEDAKVRYEAAIRAREVSKMVRYGAPLMMKYETPAAWEIVRLMGALIKREFGGNRQLIGAWQQARLHAPRPLRLAAPDAVKLLPAGTGTALTVATSGGVAADRVPLETPTAIAPTEHQLALPAGPDRHNLLRRVFRLFGSAA
jgi:hypothetical protein